MIFRLSDDETQSCDTGCHTPAYEEQYQCLYHLKQQVTHHTVRTILVNDIGEYIYCNVMSESVSLEIFSRFVFYCVFFFIYRRKTATMRTSLQPYLVRRGTGKICLYRLRFIVLIVPKCFHCVILCVTEHILRQRTRGSLESKISKYHH